MILKQVGNKYWLGCPGCRKYTMILSDLPRPFDPALDDIAYCQNRRTCPLPPRKFKLVNLAARRAAELRASAAMIARNPGFVMRPRR
ncbi:MAG: hypothetical protein ACREJF_04680 [Candidatus Methylomirabilales bacterium]